MNEKVSVIITTYGADEMLVRAIDSVLNQTYSNLEVIVVDDNNPDTNTRTKTEQMMAQYIGNHRVIYLKHEKNKNGAAARNTGIAKAVGAYIAFLDDDDFYLPNRISSAVEILEQRDDLSGACFGVIKMFQNLIISVETFKNGHIMTIQDMFTGLAIGSGSNIFLRTELVKQIAGFDVEFKRKQDLEFMLRAIEAGRVIYDSRIMVVKDVSGIRQINYENNRNALLQFNNKFAEEIKQLDEEERRIYYLNQYQFLFQIAEDSADPKNIIHAMQELAAYNPEVSHVNVKCVILKSKVTSGIKYGVFRKVFDRVKLLKHTKQSSIFRDQIGEDTYFEIMKIINNSGA